MQLNCPNTSPSPTLGWPFTLCTQISFVNTFSTVCLHYFAGKIGFAGHSNYSSSKAGVIAFTKSASKELGKYGIRVNCICPGFIETPMADNMMTEVNSEEAQRIKEILKLQIPMGDFGLPEDVAEVAAFLASEKAKYITGAIVDVNGGYY